MSFSDVLAVMSETSRRGTGDSLNDRLCGLSVSSSVWSEMSWFHVLIELHDWLAIFSFSAQS